MSEGQDRGRTIYLSVLAAMITSAATTYGLRALESAPTTEEPGGTVEVPAVLGLEQATASELAQSRGLRLVVTAEQPSDEHPAGRVATQEPLAGSDVPADTAINVVISTGALQVEIPDLVGRPLADARTRLTDLGLRVGPVDESGDGPPGTITALDPVPGTEVDSGTVVTLTASPAGIEVPELVGTNYRRAREQIEAAGLKVGRVRRRYDDSRPDFIVTAQDPAGGSRVQPDTEVSITIND